MENPANLERPKPKIKWLKAIVFGFLLFIITMVILFIMSFFTQSDQPVNFWWTGVITAILMAFFSWLFSRLLKPAGKNQALTYGIVWTIMSATFLLIIALPNGTTDVVFGQWGTYLVFIGMGIGPIFTKTEKHL